MISRQNAEQYAWGQGCRGWHLVKTPSLSVIQEEMPPLTSETRHVHDISRQFFFLLAGGLTIEIEGTRHSLCPQEGIEVLPGEAHQVSNDAGSIAEFIVVSLPPSHGDRRPAEALAPGPSESP
jgi:mannose-6-phosphate isomerase-like protein (cupin superfamily)